MEEVFKALARSSPPLAIAGIISSFLFYGIRECLRRNLIPPIAKRDSRGAIYLIINKLFILSLLALVLGFVAYAVDRYFAYHNQGANESDKVSDDESVSTGSTIPSRGTDGIASSFARKQDDSTGRRDLLMSHNLVPARDLEFNAIANESDKVSNDESVSTGSAIPSRGTDGTASGSARKQDDSTGKRVLFISHNLVPARDLEFNAISETLVGAEIIVPQNASRRDFLESFPRTYDVVHFATKIGTGYLEFSDGLLTFQEAAAILESKSFGSHLIVSPGCDNYEWSKYLEKANARWLLVIHPDSLPNAGSFFLRNFYSLINVGEEIPAAYNQAVVATDIEFGIDSARWFILDQPRQGDKSGA
jgi:hypothetical protein